MFVLGMYICYVVLATITVYAEKGCPQSIPTMHVVDKCPEDITGWIKAKKKKQCHQIQQNCSKIEDFEYHCLPNSVLDSLLEVCTPKRMIVGNFCPFYDVQQHNIGPNYNQPCQEHEKSCPQAYSSNEVYKYQGCFREVTKVLFSPKEPEKIYVMQETKTEPAFLVGIYLIFASLAAVLALFAVRVHLLQHKCCEGGDGEIRNQQENPEEIVQMTMLTE